MAVYIYRCGSCGWERDEEHPIGTARRMRGCIHCGAVMRLVVGRGLYIAADATPNKRHDVRAANARERRWTKDMDAYRRMRRRGLQPRKIDGSTRVEDSCGDQIDISFGHLYGTYEVDGKKRRVGRGDYAEQVEAMQDAGVMGGRIDQTTSRL